MTGQGDEEWGGDLTGTGTLAQDTTHPEVRADVLSGIGPSDALLPWDRLPISTAEPVDEKGLQDNTQISSDKGDKLAVVWQPTVSPDTAWAGRASFVGYLQDWVSATSSDSWNVRNTGEFVVDRVGLSAAAITTPLKFLRMGGPTQSVEFDDDVVESSSWGDYMIYGGGFAGQSDPRCEQGGCMRIGPVRYDFCAMPRAGFAAQLQRLAGGLVELRYRILADPLEQPNSLPSLIGEVVTLEVASPGAAPVDHGVQGSSAAIALLAAPVDGMHYGSDWQTFEVPAPAGSGPIGVAVAAGGYSLLRGGCGGPPMPASSVEILVEHVKSK
jgi:hypothetical protein